MEHQEAFSKLTEVLSYLRENKTNREVAIVITELEKLIAYYRIFVIDKYDLIDANSN